MILDKNLGIMENFYSLQRTELEHRCQTAGLPLIHAATLFRSSYKSLTTEPWATPGLPQGLQQIIGDQIECRLPARSRILVSRYDQSVKFLLRLHDGTEVESVLMPESKRITLCVSSQVGCRQACTFCHTGRMGLVRNLTAGEITGQLVAADLWISENPDWLSTLKLPANQRITNVVFMGMGEPLDNVPAVASAISILTDPLGAGLAKRRISVSTAGHLDGLQHMLALHPDVRLAISVHSPFESERSRIMPINRRWPLRDVFAALEMAETQRENGVLIQYTLIRGVNDSLRHAEELAHLTARLKVKINLIPLNEIDPSRFASPEENTVNQFRDYLHNQGIRVMVRYSKGQDIGAACGQLVTTKNN